MTEWLIFGVVMVMLLLSEHWTAICFLLMLIAKVIPAGQAPLAAFVLFVMAIVRNFINQGVFKK